MYQIPKIIHDDIKKISKILEHTNRYPITNKNALLQKIFLN